MMYLLTKTSVSDLVDRHQLYYADEDDRLEEYLRVSGIRYAEHSLMHVHTLCCWQPENDTEVALCLMRGDWERMCLMRGDWERSRWMIAEKGFEGPYDKDI